MSTGDALTLGSRAHTLSFSCPVCTPVQLGVDAGERDSTLVVSVPVKPATLVVDGDVSRTYQIVEHPELAIRAGTNSVPLRSAYEPVTVKQIETGDHGLGAARGRQDDARRLSVATFGRPSREASENGCRRRTARWIVSRVRPWAEPSTRSSTRRARGPTLVALLRRRVSHGRGRAGARGRGERPREGPQRLRGAQVRRRRGAFARAPRSARQGR